MAGGGWRFKMIRLGLSKLWEFSQSSWLQLFFLLGQPPAESKVSGSSLTDSFGPVKLQRSSSRSSSSSEFTSPCTFHPGHSFPLKKKEKERQEEEEKKLGYRFQRTPETPGETKEKQRRDKRGFCELRVLFFVTLSSESTKMQRVLLFFLLFFFFYSAEFRKSFFSFILTFFSSLQGHPASTF